MREQELAEPEEVMARLQGVASASSRVFILALMPIGNYQLLERLHEQLSIVRKDCVVLVLPCLESNLAELVHRLSEGGQERVDKAERFFRSMQDKTRASTMHHFLSHINKITRDDLF